MFHDVRQALQRIRRRPTVSALIVITLAVGIAGATVGFTLADALRWHPLPFADADRLVRVRLSASGAASAADVLQAWRGQDQILDGLYPFALDSAIVTVGGEPEAVTVANLAPGLLGALGVTPASGRDFERGDLTDGGHTVIVSGDLWRRLHPAGSTTGGTLVVEGVTQTVIGVMPDGVEFPVSHVAVWRPSLPGPTVRHVTAVGKLKRGVTLDAAQAIARSTSPGAGESRDRRVEITPFVALNPATSTALGVLIGAVSLLFVLAVANAANVTLSEAVRRDMEHVLRTSLGASWLRLARQATIESLCLSAVAAVAALIVSRWALDVAVKAVPYLMSFQALRPIGLDWRALACAAVMAALAGLATSSVVIFRARGIDVQAALRGQSSGLRSHWRIRDVLTVAQIAISLALLVNAGLLANSVWRLDRADPGFDPHQVVRLTMQFPAARLADEAQTRVALEEIRQEAVSLPGVASATIAYAMPPGLDSRQVEGLEAASAVSQLSGGAVWFGRVDGDFFSTLRIPVLAGRSFDTRDGPAAEPVAVVSRALAARWWPDGAALGRRFRETGDDPWRTIVGVVADVTNTDVDQTQGQLAFYTPRAQSPTWWYEGLIVRIATPPALVVPALRAVVRRAMPDTPIVDVATAEELIGSANARLRFAARLMTAFAVLALGLAVIGVYGSFGYAVRQRAREIGVRLALGAAPTDVRRMVLGAGARLSLIGILIGVALSLVATRSLGALLIGVSASDPATLMGVSVLVAMAGLIATYLPARRASKIDPLIILRSE